MSGAEALSAGWIEGPESGGVGEGRGLGLDTLNWGGVDGYEIGRGEVELEDPEIIISGGSENVFFSSMSIIRAIGPSLTWHALSAEEAFAAITL